MLGLKLNHVNKNGPSTLPYLLKLSLVPPLLKRVLLHPEILKNFRSVSNPAFLSNIIERLVVVRLNQYFINNGSHEILRCAYKQKHHTSLLKVQHDLLMAIDSHGWAVLILLDISDAFDIIDRTIPLHRLRELGIWDNALDCFSFLAQNSAPRTQHRWVQ